MGPASLGFRAFLCACAETLPGRGVASGASGAWQCPALPPTDPGRRVRVGGTQAEGAAGGRGGEDRGAGGAADLPGEAAQPPCPVPAVPTRSWMAQSLDGWHGHPGHPDPPAHAFGFPRAGGAPTGPDAPDPAPAPARHLGSRICAQQDVQHRPQGWHEPPGRDPCDPPALQPHGR